MPNDLYSFSSPSLDNPFKPKSSTGQWWNTTSEGTDAFYQGGNALSGNQPATTSTDTTAKKLADIVSTVNVGTDTGTPPAGQIKIDNGVIGYELNPDMSGYTGRPGETPGNMFSPQYSVNGSALPGSHAAFLQAISGNPLKPDAEVAAQAAAIGAQNSAARQAFEDKSLLAQYPQATNIQHARQLQQSDQRAQDMWNQQNPAGAALNAFQGEAAGNQQWGMGAYGLLAPGMPGTDQYGGYWFDAGNPVRNNLGSGYNLGGGSNSYDIQLKKLQDAADAEAAARARQMTASQFNNVNFY